MIGPHRNHGARLRAFVWQGHRCVSVENATLRALFVMDKGCDLLELTHKPSDTETLHQAPAGLAPAGAMLSSALRAGAFRDQFPGGWYVMLPNGPSPCEHRGAAYGQHGEATFLPWDYSVERDEAQGVRIRAWSRLRRTPLLIERRIALDGDGATLAIEEAVTSEAAHPLDLLWGHHPTFGAPLIEAGSAVDLPACIIATAATPPAAATLRPGVRAAWPTLAGEDLSVIPGDGRNAQDFVRCEDLAGGWFAVRNPKRRAGVAVRWDEKLFPLLGYWRVLGGGDDYPWYGARTMLALEPCCDLPSLSDAAARGTAITLAPGERRTTRLEATLFSADGRKLRDVEWGGRLTWEDGHAP